jgi:hypothetical protein
MVLPQIEHPIFSHPQAKKGLGFDNTDVAVFLIVADALSS